MENAWAATHLIFSRVRSCWSREKICISRVGHMKISVSIVLHGRVKDYVYTEYVRCTYSLVHSIVLSCVVSYTALESAWFEAYGRLLGANWRWL